MSGLASTSTNGPSAHGGSISRIITAPSSFTAVNGESQKAVGFRPDETVTKPEPTDDSALAVNEAPTASASASQLHGWRPGTHSSYPPQQEPLDIRKRKRSDSRGVDSPRDPGVSEARHEARSPKRRSLNADSAVDLMSQDTEPQRKTTFPREYRETSMVPVSNTSRYVSSL